MVTSILRVFFMVLCLSSVTTGFGQQREDGQRGPGVITGQVMEGETGQPMIGANVVVKNMADSVLTSTITGVDGTFTIGRPRVPSVIVEISFLGFERTRIQLNRGDNQNLGTIKLKEDSKLLDEFVLQGQIPVGEMQGDTTSFNANAFRTRENAVAEEMVRKLPGVTIQDGQIQARGENVQKVLVDGREFFGNDPMLALRNLPADVIDKIEVLDQRSDQSRLTGFDDGNYARTINIVTRQDKRNGQFGRVYGGYGTDHRYSAGGNVNIFKGDKRISIIGLFNNINQQNFSSQDMVGIEGGGGRRGGPGGGGPGGRGGGGNFSVGQDEGIITTNSVGVNYSDKWGERTNFTASYFFNSTLNNVAQITSREIILGEQSQFYQEELFSRNRTNNHRFNSRIEHDINDKNALIIAPSFTAQANSNFTDRDARNSSGALDPLSEARTLSNLTLDSYNFSNNITYRYKFDKRGRTLSANLFTAYNERDEFIDLVNRDRDFVRNEFDTLRQETFGLSDGFNYRANLTFTEPLSEKAIGTLSYQIANNKSSADQRTFQLVAEQGIMVLDTALSNQFENLFINQRAGAGYRYNNQGLNLNIAMDYQNAALDSRSFFPVDARFQRSFHNVLPSFNVSYKKPGGNTSYRVRYRTSTNEPSVLQLQNVVNNANPLQMRIGNPNLGQSYNHTVFANLSRINMEKSKTFFMFLFASRTDNFIGNSTLIAARDTAISEEVVLRRGGQLISPANLDGQFNSRLFVTYGTPVAAIKSQFNMNSSVSFNRTPGLINNNLNLNDNIGLSQGITLTSNISKDVDFTLTSTGTYNIVNSSLQTALNNNFYVQTSTLRMYFSPNNGKTFIANTVNNNLFTGLSAGMDQSIWLWNMEAGMRFLKDNKGEIKLNVFDLLGQNASINRTVSDVSIDDVFTQVLTRYAMLSFTYIIGNFKPQEREEGGAGRMMRPGGGRTW